MLKCLLSLPFIFLLAGCAHETVTPVPDRTGRTVAFLFPDQDHPHKIILLATSLNRMRYIPLPDGWIPEKMYWLHERFLVMGKRQLNAPHEFQSESRFLDPASGQFSATPICSQTPYPPFAGTWNGQPAIFSAGEKTHTTAIRALAPGRPSSPLGMLDFYAYGLRDGWMLDPHLRTNHDAHWTSAGWWEPAGKDAHGNQSFNVVPFESFDLCDASARSVMHLAKEQLDAAFHTHLAQFTAALSPDHHALLLAPSLPIFAGDAGWPHSYIYPLGYAVFEVSTGKLLYAQHGEQAIISPVCLTNDGVYALANDSAQPWRHPPDSHTFLTLQTAAGSRKICQFPASAGTEFVFNAAAAPDAKSLIVPTKTPTPKLYFIPLSPTTTAGDIRTIDLPK